MTENEKLKRRLIGANPDKEEIPEMLMQGSDFNAYQLTMIGYKEHFTNNNGLTILKRQ